MTVGEVDQLTQTALEEQALDLLQKQTLARADAAKRTPMAQQTLDAEYHV